MKFEMTVTDTFYLTGGIITFVGPVKAESQLLIQPCECEIVLNGEVKAFIRIDGEMIATRKKVADRSISTRQPIDLKAIGVEKGGFTIRSKD